MHAPSIPVCYHTSRFEQLTDETRIQARVIHRQVFSEISISKMDQMKAFYEIKGLRANDLEQRAGNLPPEDQRRTASVFSANDRVANSFGEGAPLRSTPFSNDEFRVVAQSRF